MAFIVYKTTNTENGRFYYGAHSCDSLDDGYLGSGQLIKQAIRKYGRNSFTREVVATFDTAADMYEFEELLVSHVLGRAECYNLAHGGIGPMRGMRHSAATRRKISEAGLKRTQSPATVAKLKARKMKPVSEDTRKKMSEAAKRRDPSTRTAPPLRKKKCPPTEPTL